MSGTANGVIRAMALALIAGCGGGGGGGDNGTPTSRSAADAMCRRAVACGVSLPGTYEDCINYYIHRNNDSVTLQCANSATCSKYYQCAANL
jgi:hypothetical protein